MIKWANVFISMILEAIPFILIGAIISSLIQLYIEEDLVKKILPKNKFIAMIFAAFLGIFIPICECAIIPIARSLVKKGVPIYIAIVFMLTVPIVNPVVVLSTFFAFDSVSIILLRTFGGIISAIIIGLLIELLINKNEKIIKSNEGYKSLCDCGCENIDYFYNKSKIRLCLEHSTKEFLNILNYYIFGSLLASIFIIIVDEKLIINYSRGLIIPVIILMALAFLLSICSEADAFIARGFLEYFGIPPIIAFLVLGPMIDLKNTIIMFSCFKKSFVLKLITLIFIVVFGVSVSIVFII